MKILLTNDDGYNSPGIQLLKELLRKSHEVYFCAPLRQMSATGHAITLFKPMEIRKLKENEFALDGTPADCVKVSLYHIFQDIDFDLIISGINNGPNMGDDIFYSGTVAAAREGSMNKLFAIAVSQDEWNEDKDFILAANFVAEMVDNLKPELFNDEIVLNINIPNTNKPNGIKITHLGVRVYKDSVIFERKDNKDMVTITGDDPGYQDDPGSDLNAVAEGFISITPIANEVFENHIRQKITYLQEVDWKSIRV